jgi:hypothetical protein
MDHPGIRMAPLLFARERRTTGNLEAQLKKDNKGRQHRQRSARLDVGDDQPTIFGLGEKREAVRRYYKLQLQHC